VSKIKELFSLIENGGLNEKLGMVYGKENVEIQKKRYLDAIIAFEKTYPGFDDIALYSAPGRTEISGNHTDHNHGRVVAASVNLDVIAVVAKSGDNEIRIKSEGFPEDVISTDDLSVKEEEKNTSASLIRGVAFKITETGNAVGGFRAYTTSNVLKGSGLSSSAAFEVLVGTIINHEFCGGKLSDVDVAKIGQFAESAYFGKPSGLLDQTASSVGSFVAVDFKDPSAPVINKVAFDFQSSGYSLCIVDTGGNHADLTGDYAAVPTEMKAVAALFGKEVLRDVDKSDFYKNIGTVREKLSDRAVLRAIHFFEEDERAAKAAEVLDKGDFEAFKNIIITSGRSSYMYLQNVYTCKNPEEQGLSLALALSEKLLSGKGAWRVHGGGFAGTIQAFVPNEFLSEYKSAIESVFGKDSCYVLLVRPVGGCKIA
jgi:galactokinase